MRPILRKRHVRLGARMSRSVPSCSQPARARRRLKNKRSHGHRTGMLRRTMSAIERRAIELQRGLDHPRSAVQAPAWQRQSIVSKQAAPSRTFPSSLFKERGDAFRHDARNDASPFFALTASSRTTRGTARSPSPPTSEHPTRRRQLTEMERRKADRRFIMFGGREERPQKRAETLT